MTYHVTQIKFDFKDVFYKMIQIVRALWLAIKPFYMSVCKHGFRSSFISYFIKETILHFFNITVNKEKRPVWMFKNC